ncbi:EAL domain-containing protein [Piscinibacter sp.]|uniref:putative bifunctional diguanylate cyclase/phosphodiesterase n=1 Tax=Piscinibacter sp. TaxID=1903157 RepID=UPI001DD6151A|nr:EAL domain-containing protein [Piscinibacter sp.]MBK7532168.1 EAL domain-containing protein [Piscinibacter sp.]
MDNDAFIAWQFLPLLDAAAVLLSALAFYVSFDIVRRVAATSGRVAALWLSAAAVSFGTGLWCVHFITAAARPLSLPLGYGGSLTALGWLAGVLASAAALKLVATGGIGALRVAPAALLVAVVAVASKMLYVLDMRLAPEPRWAWLWPALAVAGLTVLLAAGGWLTGGARRASVGFRAAAALLVGVAVVGAQRLVVLGAKVPQGAVSLHHMGVLSDHTLTALAVLGTGAIVLMLLVLTIMESRMRQALRAAIERVEESARTDALTQLPNRHSFDLRLDAATRRAEGAPTPMAVLFIGLDNFKPVNDSFGRRVGDLLLQTMAQRLRAAVASRGMLARVGGDEFVLLLGPDTDRAAAAAMAQQLLEVLAEPCEIEGRPAPITGSIGVVLYPRDGSLTTAMVNAEAAARYAKRNGGATFAFFEPRMLGDAREQVELLRDLRQAVARQQLELYYQPKVHAPSGQITGAEALLRWHHPQRGMVSPAVFIPIAERHGLIGVLGQWVIDEACRQARVWRDEGLRMRVAINLSVHQLRQPDLAERIAAALQRHQVNPQLLTCEITESAAMEDGEGTMRIFEKLAAVGVHISIDDFGTGYSSLAYLRKLPAGELKIDRGFVLDLESSADARAVVDAVVKLAQALGLKVVAEGVETEGQANVLRSLGCDELQGYLYAKPMSAKALALWAMNDDGPRSIEFRASLFQETQPTSLH